MYEQQKVAVLIAAAGSGKRMGGGLAKQYRTLGGMPILSRAVMAFDSHPLVDSIYIIAKEEELDYCRQMLAPSGFSKIRGLVPGGRERQDSVRNGLDALKDENLVLIHDGARPFVTAEIITQTVEMTARCQAAVAAVPAKDTIKVAKDLGLDASEGSESGMVFTATPDRKTLFQVQTPQGFSRSVIEDAYRQAEIENFYGTDDAVLVERTGKKVYLVRGDYKNIKVTTSEDMEIGEAILRLMGREESEGETTVEYGMETEYRMGTGFDVHQLVEGRKLILGGVDIPWERGLAGHSDADVLVHAVMDALLGAAAMGDIGRHFPDSDQRYRGIDSLLLLREVVELLRQAGWQPVNVDATVIAQRPKIAPHIEAMRGNMARILWPQLSPEEAIGRVNVKGTTTEKLGFCGREEGIAAEAVACLKRKV